MAGRSSLASPAAIAVFGATGLLVVAGCSRHGGAADSAPARLVLPETVLDLGVGSPGEELTGTIPVKNAGRGPLHIVNLEGGCDCAGLTISRKTVPPGEEAVIRVRVRIKAEGQHLQFPVRIFSNDPEVPLASHTVRAEGAAPVVRVEPGELDFGEVAVGTAPVRQLRLRKPDGEAWSAEARVVVEPGHAQVAAEAVHVRGDRGAALALRVQPRPDLPLGPFADSLTLRPQGSQRLVRVAVRGQVVPKVVVSPTTLYFGDVDARKEPLKRTVLLRRTDGQTRAKVARHMAPLGLRVEQQEGSPGQDTGPTIRVQVTLDPGLVKEDLKDGQVQLWLEDEPEPVTVRVMVFMARNGIGG